MNRHTDRLRGGRSLGLAALALGIAAALAGCSPAAEEPVETSEPAESALSGDLSVYAAASLDPIFIELSEDFQAENPDVNFEFSFDGSSTLAEQIIGGAPADLFASADEPNMAKITDESLGEGEPIAFATSELMIAVAPGNPHGIETLEDLTSVVTAVCAPEVPCGNASQTLLERDGVELTPATEEKNVTAVLTRVTEGEADAGLVYRSDVLSAGDEVEGIEIPDAADAAGDYLIVPIAGTQSLDAAQAFAEFLLTDEAQQKFADAGFGRAR